MRLAWAQWRQETNSFNPRPTDWAEYARAGFSDDDDVLLTAYGNVDELGGFVEALRDPAAGPLTSLPLMRAVAWSGGPLEPATADRLLAILLRRLEAALPVEGVLLSLHGATAATDRPDLTGEIVTAVRRLIGPAARLAVTLDLHADLTPALVRGADFILGYRTNPHVDLVEVGRDAAQLLLRSLRGECRPVTALRKVPALFGPEHQGTAEGPLADLFQRARQLEASGQALVARLFPVAPWHDSPHLSSGVIVTCDGDGELADRLADELADGLWERRQAGRSQRLPVPEVLDRVRSSGRWPVVIAEPADATNAGAPGDSTILLRALLASGLPGPLLVSVVDPLAATVCARAGVGAWLTLPLGGKIDRRGGPPLTVTGRVRACSDGRYRLFGHGGYNLPFDAGLSAVLELGEVLVAITSHATVGSSPKVYRTLGLDPARARAVVVKSALGFRHDYAPLAGAIVIADTPGAAAWQAEPRPHRLAPPGLWPWADRPDRHLPELAASEIRAAPPGNPL